MQFPLSDRPVRLGLRVAGGTRQLADWLVLCVELAETGAELGAWWRSHQAALKALPPDELARVTAAKDRRKLQLAAS